MSGDLVLEALVDQCLDSSPVGWGGSSRSAVVPGRPAARTRTQTDGPATPSDLDRTEANRALVAEFAEKVLKGADYSVLTNYISTETYHQHNPEAADGLDGFGAAAAKWAEQGKNLVYKTVHKVVAEGDFVLLQSEGEFGVPVAYWDLFRVADGKIVEHWDVIAPVPAELPYTNGLF
ncbi:ester cyclase [Streptomyces sp. NPDC127197]|uniref:nuclear transport factor 2 family protein n=1 Tax=Streptomyces sp. NPDC127197 TaxID=3345388 RepID=UPI00363032E9